MDTAVPVFIQTPLCGYAVTVTTTNTDPWLSFSAAGAEGSLYSVYSVDVNLDQKTVLVNFVGTAASPTPFSSAVVTVDVFFDSPTCDVTTLNTQVLADMTTTVKVGTAVTQTFTYFTDLSGISTGIPANCGPRTYALTGNGAFLTLTVPADPFTTALTLTLQTDNDSDIGSHPVTLTVSLVNYPTVTPVTATFNAIINPCVIVSMVLAAGDIN